MYSKTDILSSWGGKAYLKRVIGDNKEELEAFSPIHHVDKIDAKVMLIQGSFDKRVPVEHGLGNEKKIDGCEQRGYMAASHK